MGTHKPSLTLAPGSPPLGAIALRQMTECARLGRISVVVNAADSLEWLADSSLDAVRSRFRVVRCFDAELGMSRSLKAGLRDAREGHSDGVMIVLADQPFVTTELLDRVADAYASNEQLDYVACEIGGEAMPPVMLGPAMYDAIDRLEGDAGARRLLLSGEYRGRRLVIESPEALMDIDDPGQLEQASKLWSAESSGANASRTQ
ncbi:nucleotidyltransferase family protein [Cohnella yongneupensis]|uniref:NTP transferase domain-containing protein n=1 Tax=Cohnella yongneupensis TaxID=425006 RepID=A0ABW0R5D0_9BACL